MERWLQSASTIFVYFVMNNGLWSREQIHPTSRKICCLQFASTRVFGAEVYQSMTRADPDTSVLLLVATAPIAHIDLLLNTSHKPFSSGLLKRHPDRQMRGSFEVAVKSINNALLSMQEGF